jgi:hypothetical protein
LNQVNDQDDDGNYKQEMDQAAANVADEAKKPEHDQDDNYSPEHGYSFQLIKLSSAYLSSALSIRQAFLEHRVEKFCFPSARFKGRLYQGRHRQGSAMSIPKNRTVYWTERLSLVISQAAWVQSTTT